MRTRLFLAIALYNFFCSSALQAVSEISVTGADGEVVSINEGDLTTVVSNVQFCGNVGTAVVTATCGGGGGGCGDCGCSVSVAGEPDFGEVSVGVNSGIVSPTDIQDLVNTLSCGGSTIDNHSFNYIHNAVDYEAATRASGCGSCGSSAPKDSLLNASIQRFHRSRNMTEGSSFGPGVFSNYDRRLTFYESDGKRYLDLFDPFEVRAYTLMDDDENGVRDGVYSDGATEYIRALRVFDAGGQLVTGNLQQAVRAKLENKNGQTIEFDVFDGSSVQPIWLEDIFRGRSIRINSNHELTVAGYKGVSGSASRTTAAWVRTSESKGSIMQWGANPWGQRWGFRVNGVGGAGEGALRLEIGRGVVVGTTDLRDGAWHHVAAVLPEGKTNIQDAILYVDGQPETLSFSQGYAVNTAATDDVRICTDDRGRRFDGDVDDVRIYSRGLSAAEIQELASSNDITGGLEGHWKMDETEGVIASDSSANGRDATVVNVDPEYVARLASMSQRNGYGVNLNYVHAATAAIADSTQKWQLASVVDAHGRTLGFNYAADQVGGQWVIESINLPNGESIAYEYAQGQLSRVIHPDGSETTIDVEIVSDFVRYTYRDAGSDTTHRNKQVYFSTGIVLDDGAGGTLFNQAAMLVRSVVNADNELVYANSVESANVRKVFEAGVLSRQRHISEKRYYKDWSLAEGQSFQDGLSGILDDNFASYTWWDVPNTTFEDTMQGTPGTVRDDKGVEFNFEYNSDNLISKKTYSDQTFESWDYDIAAQGGIQQNLITRYRDRLGRVTKATYNALGNVLTQETGILDDSGSDVIQPSEYAKTVYEYVPAGQVNQHLLATVFDPLYDPGSPDLHRTDYDYDSDNFISKVIHSADVSGGPRPEESFVYNDAGQLESTTDAQGRVTSYQYDERDRQVLTTYADTSTEAIFYGTGLQANLVIARKDRNNHYTQFRYDDAGRVVTTISGLVSEADALNQALTPDESLHAIKTCQYLPGTSLRKSCKTNGETTSYGYDFRQRLVSTTVHPREGVALTTSSEYQDNLLFSRTDPYGRKTFMAYRSSDSRPIRQVQTTHPGVAPPANFDQVIGLTRGGDHQNPVSNGNFLIRDTILDAEGQTIAMIDPRGIVDARVYDSRGRSKLMIEAATTLPPYNQGTFDPTDDTQLNNLAKKTTTIYDAASNVIEIRSPRYSDSDDAGGFNKASTQYTYTGRNLRSSETIAAGADPYEEGEPLKVSATRTFTYNLDGTIDKQSDFRGNETENVWSPCCQRRLLSTIDPTGLARNRQYDFYGNVTVSDSSKAQTEQLSTTRYDSRNRPIARTVWLVEPSEIDANDPPIAGMNGVDASEGLTTRMLYDDSLTDQTGLNAGVTLDRLDGSGTFTVSASGLLGKLADAGVSTGLESNFSARATINPEEEISLAITDGVGRTVISGIIAGDAAGTPITWSITQHDATEDVAGFGVCLVTKTINAVGDVTQSFTDGAGRVIQGVDGAGMISTRQYDGNGNTLVSRDANGVGQDCVFDVHDRDVQCTDTAGDVTSRTYDLADNVVSKTDAKGKIDTCSFDPLGRQYQCTDRIGGITGMRYDQDNHLLTLTDAEGQVTAYTYDSVGNKLTETYPDHVAGSSIGDAGYGIITHSYDALHRTSVTTDQQGDTRTMAYDLAGRLLSKTYVGHASGPLAGTSDVDSFTYDDASRMLTATSQRYNNVCEMTYDDAGRKASESLTIGGQTYTCTTDYDDVGRVATTTYPDGTEVSRTYTNRSQLETVARDGVTIDTRTYDDGGRMATSAYNNGVSETRTYNADNTLSDIAFAGAAIGDLAYTWDDNKNKTTELIGGVMSDFGFDSTGYDDEDRLTAWDRADNALNQSWNLSLVGDWDSVTENGSVQNRTHGQAHELLSAAGQAVQHDAKGNQTLIPAVLTTDGTSNLSLSWDFDNKLLGADTDEDGVIDVSYAFDATGRRVARTAGGATTVFVQSGQQTIADYTIGTSAASPIYTYYYASYIDEPVMRAGSGGLRYYHRNQQYSIIALTAGNGNVSKRIAYDAYGKMECFNSNGNPVNVSSIHERYSYTGREYDEALGLYHYRARMYDPVAGRFCSRDPIGYVDGESLYSFVGNQPLVFFDPLGTCKTVCCPLALPGANGNDQEFKVSVNCPSTLNNQVCCDLAKIRYDEANPSAPPLQHNGAPAAGPCMPEIVDVGPTFPIRCPMLRTVDAPILTLCGDASGDEPGPEGTPGDGDVGIAIPGEGGGGALLDAYSCLAGGRRSFNCFVNGPPGLGGTSNPGGFARCVQRAKRLMRGKCRQGNFGGFSIACSGLARCYEMYP